MVCTKLSDLKKIKPDEGWYETPPSSRMVGNQSDTCIIPGYTVPRDEDGSSEL
jgi:hypothetical protein